MSQSDNTPSKYSEWLFRNYDNLHGTDFDDPSAPVILYLNRRSAITAFKRQIKIAVPLLLVILAVEGYGFLLHRSSMDGILCMSILLLTIGLFGALTYKLIAFRAFLNSKEPFIEIQSDGLIIRHLDLESDFISWMDIKELRTTVILGSTFLLIQLNKPMNNAKILIPESWIPLNVGELVALIKYRSICKIEKSSDR